MATATAMLTRHDACVLEKIKDPEATPSPPVLIDDSLPSDPNVSDPLEYASILKTELDVLRTIKDLASQADPGTRTGRSKLLASWLVCILELDRLTEKHPHYASARNNKVQALLTVYGNDMFVKSAGVQQSCEVRIARNNEPVVDLYARHETLEQASTKVLDELSIAIGLLTPKIPFAAMSKFQVNTLKKLFETRGMIYKTIGKMLGESGAELRIKEPQREARWSAVEFLRSASRDFMMAGQYGSDMAKVLAVTTNPDGKLCGEMVKEAMRKEYSGENATFEKNVAKTKDAVRKTMNRKHVKNNLDKTKDTYQETIKQSLFDKNAEKPNNMVEEAINEVYIHEPTENAKDFG